MEKIRKIVLLGAVFTLLCMVPAYAVEQGEPQDTLSLKEVQFFEYDLKKKTGPEKYQLKLPVAIETEGLRGPLPLDNPVAAYFWEKFKEKGLKTALEYNPSAAKDYQTPYMRMFAVQSVGTPVKIKLRAPELDEITMPLAGEGGKSGNTRYKVLKRIFNVRILDREGDMTLDKNKENIKLVEKNDTMEISWIPSLVEKKRGPKLTAPIVVEINLEYKIRLEAILEGKYLGGFFQEGWVERRVVWIAMPVCGQEFGEDYEPIACPESIAPGPLWKEYSMGPVSLQVPDNWESEIRDGSGNFELGREIAGITVVRAEGGEEQIEYIKERTQENIVISGLNAVKYTGLVKDGKVRATLILFKDNPSDGKALGVATVVKDNRYMDILEASLNSLTIDNGQAPLPGTAPIPTPHIPELGDLGKGEYSYSPDNIPQEEYTRAEPANPPVKEEEPDIILTPAAPVENPPAAKGDKVKGSLKLKKLTGFSDFVGRNETLQGDGSPDCQLRLEIEAEGNKTITSLILRGTDSQKAIWDTTTGNNTWLIGVTKKNRPINLADGSLWYPLGSGREDLDLWLQDNHTIAAGKKKLELVVEFDDNETLIVPLTR